MERSLYPFCVLKTTISPLFLNVSSQNFQEMFVVTERRCRANFGPNESFLGAFFYVDGGVGSCMVDGGFCKVDGLKIHLKLQFPCAWSLVVMIAETYETSSQ